MAMPIKRNVMVKHVGSSTNRYYSARRGGVNKWNASDRATPQIPMNAVGRILLDSSSEDVVVKFTGVNYPVIISRRDIVILEEVFVPQKPKASPEGVNIPMRKLP